MSLNNLLSAILYKINRRISTWLTKLQLKFYSVEFGRNFISVGLVDFNIHKTSIFQINDNLVLINSRKYSVLGKCNPCKITVGKNAKLVIGSKVGMSNVTIIAYNNISIGSNILLGGGVIIVDTDFHSLSHTDWHTDADNVNMKTSPVIIHDNVFIGMDAIILKGVEIGMNSIIGAGSVVSKSIPANEVWAGNPARFVKKVIT